MPGRLLNGQQQKDPKHHVKADEHRPNLVIPVKPAGTPQSIEQEVTPKGIKQAHQDQNDLQSALTLHTVLRFGNTDHDCVILNYNTILSVKFCLKIFCLALSS